jgi:hypothetical protein
MDGADLSVRLKRERRPPTKWRRNMVTAAAFLVLLDAVIISAAPNSTRIAFAMVVTIVVGFAILRIWRSNTRIERASADLEQRESAGRKPSAGDGPAKKRQAQ